jgi:hypothetical protein
MTTAATIDRAASHGERLNFVKAEKREGPLRSPTFNPPSALAGGMFTTVALPLSNHFSLRGLRIQGSTVYRNHGIGSNNLAQIEIVSPRLDLAYEVVAVLNSFFPRKTRRISQN